MTSVLAFVGEPFGTTPWLPPETTPEPSFATTTTIDSPGVDSALADLQVAVSDAHRSALRAQTALLQLICANDPPVTNELVTPAEEGSFKPLARTDVTQLDHSQLVMLANGDIAAVFGAAYDQGGANPDIRLGTGSPLVLTSMERIDRQAGRLTARCTTGDPVTATTQAAQLFALHIGLHLCLADATFVHEHAGEATGNTGDQLELEVLEADLVPRPSLRVNARFSGGGRVTGLTVTVREKPGTPVGPGQGGVVSTWLGRMSAAKEPAMLSEFHLAHLSRGDQGVAFGPEFAQYNGRKATRLPTGGLLLVDRVIHIDGERGRLDHASYQTEYDSPADSWYYADTANASMPHFVYMEASLQAALLVGYYLGPTLATPDEAASLRNLGGTATVLREVNLRDTTIRQHSELLGTTVLPGSSLQNFAYTLSVDGEPFYRGETLFGYFSDEALANQTGLDSGRTVPTWIEEHPAPVRRLELAARRADPSARPCARRKLALLDYVDVVDGGGRYGQGYLHSVRRIDPNDWFFTRHFYLDPVIPGSLGIESVIHAMQEWLLNSGLADDLRDPGFIIPVGHEFTWKYRGQFLPTDGACTLEVHIKDVRQSAQRVRVIGDASLWKPGLRIYELTDIAVELREPGAQPW